VLFWGVVWSGGVEADEAVELIAPCSGHRTAASQGACLELPPQEEPGRAAARQNRRWHSALEKASH